MKNLSLGQVVVTAAINESIIADPEFAIGIINSLERYCNYDWGELCEEDKLKNDLAIENEEERIFAAYEICSEKIYIITEWDRSATTILFSSEY